MLVHEHLLTCPACMKAYRELKGTGKALEAVEDPCDRSRRRRRSKKAMREQAKAESEKIVSKLPPDKRLRLEARREARQSVRTSRRAPPPKVWSPGLLVLALGAAAVLAAILFWPAQDRSSSTRSRWAPCQLRWAKSISFTRKKSKTYTPVEEGKSFLPGDWFKTGESGGSALRSDRGRIGFRRTF